MSESRGQLILVAALGLAVVFVALALLLNTAIYAENLATRGADVGGGDAVAYQSAAESGAAGAVARANEYNHSSYDDAVSRVRADVRRWSEDAGAYAALDSSAASATLVNVTNGTTIAQDADADFTDAGGESEWTLADDVTGVRRFELNVTRGSLLQEEDEDLDEVSDLRSSSALRVNASNDSHDYAAYLYENDSNYVVVAVVDETDDVAGTCGVQASRVTIDLTEGLLAGEECDALAFPGIAGPFDLAYDDAGSAAGSYQLVVDVRVGQLDGSHYDTYPNDPYRVPAVYDATLTVRVATPELSYEGNVTAAPSEGVGGPGVDG